MSQEVCQALEPGRHSLIRAPACLALSEVEPTQCALSQEGTQYLSTFVGVAVPPNDDFVPVAGECFWK